MKNAIPDSLKVTIARNLDQVVMAMTLRGVIYLGEQFAPYSEEYDGNDLVGAAHLIAWRGAEPVGVLRLRFFADFAKVERAAVLRQFRRYGVMRVLMQEAQRYSARRGYRKMLGQRPAQPGQILAHTWLPDSRRAPGVRLLGL